MYFSASCCWPMLRDAIAHARVGGAEVRIPLHRLCKAPKGILVPVVREGQHPNRKVMHGLQRGGRQGLQGEALRGFRRIVAERSANFGREFRRHLQDPFFIRRRALSLRDHRAAHRLRRGDRNTVALRDTIQRTGENDPDPLFHRDFLRSPIIQLLGWLHSERAADSGTVVRADEARTFQGELEHRLEGAVERRIAGDVLEVCDQDRHRIVRRWSDCTDASTRGCRLKGPAAATQPPPEVAARPCA